MPVSEMLVRRDGKCVIVEVPQGNCGGEYGFLVLMLAICGFGLKIASPSLWLWDFRIGSLKFWLEALFLVPWYTMGFLIFTRLFLPPAPARLILDLRELTYDSGRYGWGWLSTKYNDESEFGRLYRRMFQRRRRWRIQCEEAMQTPLRWQLAGEQWSLFVGDKEYSFGLNIPSSSRPLVADLVEAWRNSSDRLDEIVARTATKPAS